MNKKYMCAGACGCTDATGGATRFIATAIADDATESGANQSSTVHCSGCRQGQCCSTASTPNSVLLSQNRILIDGTPRLVLAGEIHYFRLAPDQWEDRLQKLQDNGLDTVASYIPWLWHELADGSVDLTGRTHPQRNLVAFLDACARRGLHFIARPGPFVMAELKNEGIPQRLYVEPHKQPTTWDGKGVTTHTLDYLAPDFLAAARSWYDAVMPVVAQYLRPNGGPIIAVQLDNEIGMLSWVSNCPDLTDNVCEDMRLWARNELGPAKASQMVGVDSFDQAAWAAKLRSPGDDSLALHQALGLYMRNRFARYVQILRFYAEENGVRGVPFLINVHGTGGGKARTFPIGISQLKETYQGQPQTTAGADHYLGSLTTGNVADLIVANAYLSATLGADQPASVLEFEAGDGNYGDDLGMLYDPESVDLKTRLCIAQQYRMLNFYLHAGGENPSMPSLGDGIDRLAFSGQRHGFAAPVSPEGKLHPSYFALGRVVQSMRAVEDLLADSRTEYDGVAFAFVPNHFLTEYRYPGSQARTAQIADMERYRGMGPRDMIARALVLNNYSFPAVNLEEGAPDVPVLVLTTGRTLGADVQTSIVDYLENGGRVLMVGLLPEVDYDGSPCTILSDALRLKSAGRVEDAIGPNGQYWPSVATPQGTVSWLAPRPDVRASTVQLLASTDDTPLMPLLVEIASGKPCATTVEVGCGRLTFLGCDYPADLTFYRELFSQLGVQPTWQILAQEPGVIAMSTITSDDQRLLHVVNVAPYPVSFRLKARGKAAFGGKILRVKARGGLMLPLNVKVEGAVIKYSTAELVQRSSDGFVVRPTQQQDVVHLKTERRVTCRGAKVSIRGSTVILRLFKTVHRGRDVKIKVH